jgi:hypothetical protein
LQASARAGGSRARRWLARELGRRGAGRASWAAGAELGRCRRAGGGEEWAARNGPGKGAGPLFLFPFSSFFLSVFYLFQFNSMHKQMIN